MLVLQVVISVSSLNSRYAAIEIVGLLCCSRCAAVTVLQALQVLEDTATALGQAPSQRLNSPSQRADLQRCHAAGSPRR